MAIIQGYTPAQQPQLTQPWQLPFNEMYTALKDKQSIADAEAAKSDELMITLGNITNLLEPDLYIHKNKMSNVLAKEQELRSQVGDDLTRPEYRQGLRKLVLETATDPFYSAAMGNYQTYHENYLKDKRTLQLAGQYNEAFDNFAPDYANYKGAINPDGTLNVLEYDGISRVDDFLTKVDDMASKIKSTTLEGYRLNPKTQMWESYGKESLSSQEIQETLWKNLDNLTMEPEFEKYRKRWLYTNRGSLNGLSEDEQEAAFSQHIDDLFKGYSEIYDISKTSVQPTPGMNDGSGDDEKTLNYKDFMQYEKTVGSDSSGFASPDKAKEFKEYTQKVIDTTLARDKAELESYLAKSLGVKAVTITPTFVAGNISGEAGQIETFSKNTDRLDLTIKDENGNVIDETHPKYKENYQEINRLKYSYEQAYTAMDRVDEFDAYARATSKYDAKEDSNILKQANLNAKEDFNKDISSIYKAGRSLKLKDGQVLTGEELAAINYWGKNEGVDYSFTEEERNKLIKSALSKMEFQKPTAMKPTSTIPGWGTSNSLEELSSKIETAAVEKNYKKLKESNQPYKDYIAIYEEAYAKGLYPVTQYSNSFGYDDDAKKYKETLKSELISHIRATLEPGGENFRGIQIYDPYENVELTGKAYTDLIKELQTKVESDENLISTVQWRLDDGGDGLVVDLSYNGYTVELRNTNGVKGYLSNHNYQDYVFLDLLDQASKSMKSGEVTRAGSGITRTGQAGAYGYIGHQNSPDFPLMQFKRTEVPTRVLGVDYPAGSFQFQGKMYNNMYELGIAYLEAVQSQGSSLGGITLGQ